MWPKDTRMVNDLGEVSRETSPFTRYSCYFRYSLLFPVFPVFPVIPGYSGFPGLFRVSWLFPVSREEGGFSRNLPSRPAYAGCYPVAIQSLSDLTGRARARARARAALPSHSQALTLRRGLPPAGFLLTEPRAPARGSTAAPGRGAVTSAG